MIPVDTSHSPYAKLRPVPLDAVTLSDSFWAPRLSTVREVTLPTQLTQLAQTGRLDNFHRAAGLLDIPRKGYVFDDSDVYKWLEAVYWSLTSPSLLGGGSQGGEVLPTILAAQQPDGYLNTAFMFDKAAQRWTNLRDWHELYCAGHYIQAAIAQTRATGDEQILTSARKFADLICATFGPAEQGKRPSVPGHQEIEMALVELYRLTGERKYLEQAQYFLDARGHSLIGGSPYHQDHQPFRDLERPVGHAVRFLYMTCGAADLYAETGDPALLDALTRLWERATSRQMYLTGGFGARHTDEAFGDDYELPNHQAYCETCAAIASVMWNYRMALLTGDARYTDLLEHTLFNAVLPGLSADGQHYFYVNPLANDGAHTRQPWFSCACCPPNIARLVASLPGYFYSCSDNFNRSPSSTTEVVTTNSSLGSNDFSRFSLWLHLYAANTLQYSLPDGTPLTLDIRTEYPWQGDITLTVHGQGPFALHLRIPGWCADPTLTLNGTPLDPAPIPGTYYEISRPWTDGDTLTLHLPMPVCFLEAHPAVAENTGKIALQRGPILYCLESADNPAVNLDDLFLDLTQPPQTQYHPDLLNGLMTLHLPAEHRPPVEPWNHHLYRPRPSPHLQAVTPFPATAIPYYAWANRTPGQMRLWLKFISPSFPPVSPNTEKNSGTPAHA